MLLNYWPCAIVGVGFGWFAGLSQSDISWWTYTLPCNEPSTWQLSNFGILTKASHQQHTTHKPNTVHAARYKVVGSSPTAAKYIFMSM